MLLLADQILHGGSTRRRLIPARRGDLAAGHAEGHEPWVAVPCRDIGGDGVRRDVPVVLDRQRAAR
jgi:hypothetical protein